MVATHNPPLPAPELRRHAFSSWPQFSEDEIQAAVRVLASGKVNYWTGEEGRAFENEFAAGLGLPHAVAVANGSVALELALYSLDIGPGDEVIVPARSFVASATCVLLRGATPRFADVDRESGNLTPASILPLISKKTHAVIAVHLGGWPCETEEICSLARKHGVKVIEDCAQAQGASHAGRPVGTFGDVATFSFCQDKIMTTGGEGGMLVTADRKIFERAWSYKDHGKKFEAADKRNHGAGFRWVHDSVGTNWRMTEMQSAMGRVMLPKISERIRLRRRNAEILENSFARMPALRVARPPSISQSACYRYYVYLRPQHLAPRWNRDRIQAAISEKGIPCSAGSCSEIYLEKAIPEKLRPKKRLPIARELGETSLAFLVHPTLSEENMRETAEVVETVLEEASR